MNHFNFDITTGQPSGRAISLSNQTLYGGAALDSSSGTSTATPAATPAATAAATATATATAITTAITSGGGSSSLESHQIISPSSALRLPPPRPLRESYVLAQRTAHIERLPQPVNYHETLRDVEYALHNADMALRNAREAFRSGRITHTHNHEQNQNQNQNQNDNNNVVDLTTLSDDTTEDTFITPNRHPYHLPGPSTIINSMNEPTYTHTLSSPSAHSIHANTIPSFHALLESSQNPGPRRPPTQSHHLVPNISALLPRLDSTIVTPQAEASAIRRQRQAQRSWDRVARRNRERAQQQAQQDADLRARRVQSSQDSNQSTYLAATATATRPQTRPQTHQRTHSIDSNRSSSSVLSAFSLGSDSTEQDLAPVPVPNPNGLPEAIDLTAADDATSLSAILARQQAAVIASQPKLPPNHASATVLSAYKCAICMDSPSNATTTICGHLFCHRCIIDSLRWSVNQRAHDHPPHRRTQGLCPVCRKPLQSKEVSSLLTGRGSQSGGLVSLEIKTMPRKRYTENKEREKFLATLVQEPLEEDKGKQKASGSSHPDLDKMLDSGTHVAEDEDDVTIPMESSQSQSLPQGKERRKRKRSSTGTDNSEPMRRPSEDSLFGSP